MQLIKLILAKIEHSVIIPFKQIVGSCVQYLINLETFVICLYMKLCHSLNRMRMQLYQQKKTKPTADSLPSHFSSGHIEYRDHLILKTESLFYIHTKIITIIIITATHIHTSHTLDVADSCVIMVMHVYVQTTCSRFSYRTIRPFKYEQMKKKEIEKIKSKTTTNIEKQPIGKKINTLEKNNTYAYDRER